MRLIQHSQPQLKQTGQPGEQSLAQLTKENSEYEVHCGSGPMYPSCTTGDMYGSGVYNIRHTLSKET